MRVFVCDTETTGLDPNVHSIIELAMYSFDLDHKDAPTHLFHRYVYPENMVWSAYCLNLHKNILPKLIDKIIPYDSSCIIYNGFETPKSVPEAYLFKELAVWHSELNYLDRNGKLASMIGAGKNFASFDLQFIKKLPGFSNIFKHRSLDPSMAYMLPTDEVPPELIECKRRASLKGASFNRLEVTHTAVDDCMDVAELLKFAHENRKWK